MLNAMSENTEERQNLCRYLVHPKQHKQPVAFLKHFTLITPLFTIYWFVFARYKAKRLELREDELSIQDKYFVHVLAALVWDAIRLSRLSPDDKTLELLVLRQQLHILPHHQKRRPSISSSEKLILLSLLD